MFRAHTPIIMRIRCWVAAYSFLHRVCGWMVVLRAAAWVVCMARMVLCTIRAIHNGVICPSFAQMSFSPRPTTDSSSHVSPSEPTATPTPQNGKEGRSSANDECDPYTSSFAHGFKFKWLVYIHFWVMVITDCISIINKTMLNIVACLPTYLSVRHSFCSAEIDVCHRFHLRVVMSFISVKIKWKMSLETLKNSQNFISLSIRYLPINVE